MNFQNYWRKLLKNFKHNYEKYCHKLIFSHSFSFCLTSAWLSAVSGNISKCCEILLMKKCGPVMASLYTCVFVLFVLVSCVDQNFMLVPLIRFNTENSNVWCLTQTGRASWFAQRRPCPLELLRHRTSCATENVFTSLSAVTLMGANRLIISA